MSAQEESQAGAQQGGGGEEQLRPCLPTTLTEQNKLLAQVDRVPPSEFYRLIDTHCCGSIALVYLMGKRAKRQGESALRKCQALASNIFANDARAMDAIRAKGIEPISMYLLRAAMSAEAVGPATQPATAAIASAQPAVSERPSRKRNGSIGSSACSSASRRVKRNQPWTYFPSTVCSLHL
jgi:hypothetical protein